MKKIRYLLFLILGVFVMGCGNKMPDPNTKIAAETTKESLDPETVKETLSPETVEESLLSETAKESLSLDESEVSDTEAIPEAPASSPKYISIDLSGIKETHLQGDAVAPLSLSLLSEEKNGTDWPYEWYDRENLSLPMLDENWSQFYDEAYEYQWYDDELDIYDRETGNCLYILQYPTDKWYLNGNNAYMEDGIFYGCSIANGYAQPDSCFMFAYDLEQEKLLWRSADQSCNSMNFVVIDDILICGYGFTDEKDYLYQINKNTGEILDKTYLKKMPDLLVLQDNKLYVHTYSYDYIFEIKKD